MNLEKTFESFKGEVVEAGIKVFSYIGNDRPNLIWTNTVDKDVIGTNAKLDYKTGKIIIYGATLFENSKMYKRVGYRPSDKQIAVYTLGEEISHYFHSRLNPKDFDEKEKLIQNLAIRASERSISGVVEYMEKLFWNELQVEAIGKTGQRIIEKEIGTFDENMHDLNMQLTLEKTKKEWPNYYNMLLNLDERSLPRRIDFLSTLFQVPYTHVAEVAGERLAKVIFKNGADYLRKIIKESDYPFINLEILPKTMNEIYPGIEEFRKELATAYIINILRGSN